MEVATGHVPGFVPPAGDARPAAPGSPTRTLIDLVTPARDAPVFVAFSGGRDSSVVLAAAVHGARAVGAPDPIPVTLRFPAHPGTDEEAWQRRVLTWLGLRDWMRLDAGTDADLLGPRALDSLRRYGLLFPPTAHTRGRLFEEVAGHLLLTGEGGDEVFGAQRVAALTQLARGHRPSRARLRAGLEAAVPAPVRGRLLRRRFAGARRPWLRPAANAALIRALVRDERRAPLRWDQSLRRHLRRRALQTGRRNLAALAADHGVTYRHPLLERPFIEALARAGGALGYTSRTAGLETHFGSLLPPDVLGRRSKTTFNAPYFGPHTRAFARRWGGAGIRVDLVEQGALRKTWLETEPHGASAMLLHAAWLAEDGPPG